MLFSTFPTLEGMLLPSCFAFSWTRRDFLLKKHLPRQKPSKRLSELLQVVRIEEMDHAAQNIRLTEGDVS